MSLLPEIRDQLLDAAFDAEPRGRRVAGAGWPRRLSVAASLVISLGIAGVLGFSLHAGRPGGASYNGPLTPRSWVTALNRVFTVNQGKRSCATSPSAPLRLLDTPPPSSITAVLPSMARPVSGAHRVTPQQLRDSRPLVANDVYVRYAWQGELHGVHYDLVPVGLVGRRRPLPAACYRRELASFRRSAQAFPAGQRAAALAFARPLLRVAQGEPGVVVITDGRGSRGADYDTVEELSRLSTDPAAAGGGSGNDHVTKTPLLVPADVASVTATYEKQTHPGKVKQTVSVTRRPVRDFVLFVKQGAWDPPQLTFRSATGAVIYRTSR